MAYLRHFKAFLGVLLVLALAAAALTGTNGQFQFKTELSALREVGEGAPISKNLKTTRKALETFYSKKLISLGINLRPGTDHRSDSKSTPERSRRCRSLVYQTLIKLPEGHRKQLKDLTLFYAADGRRGLSGSGAVVLRCQNVADSELVSVLVHEIGHLVDADFLTGSAMENLSGFYDFGVPVTADDASSLFYKITWDSETKMESEVSEVDFVSLYAMSDPFEDFAETYTYFRLHGPEFRKLVQSSEMLRKKYEFMKWYVFDGREFGELEDREDINIWERNYDVTVLPFPLKSFLVG